jgi:uncharacterized protein
MACRSKIIKRLLLVLLFWAYPGLVTAVTPPIPAHPGQYVVDLAGVIDAGARARLNALLRDLEVKTTAQMVVLTLNSLEGEPIENFSHQTAVKWGIGKKGKDNGVLITVAVKDRKYRIEVGYGLESVLPDSLVGSIGRQYLAPHFKKGDFAGGLVGAVTVITKKISSGAGAEATPQTEEEGSKRIILLVIILSVIAGPIILIWWLSRKLMRRGARDDDGGFWGGGWSSGGWSSGGGDSGGFSGGGGDFGGGGASGDW